MRILLLATMALFLPGSFGPGSFGKASVKPSGPATQATILDHNEYTCENCLFGVSDYYVCFEAGQKILIGHEKVRTQMRRKKPVDLMRQGASVTVRFDDKYIWVAEPNGKELRLEQDYTKKIFLDNNRCQAAVK